MLFCRLRAPERANLSKATVLGVGNHLLLFLGVFLAGIAVSVFIQPLPEVFRILPVPSIVHDQQRNNVQLELAQYPPLPTGARALPWVQDLDVRDDFVQTIISKETTALHVRHTETAKDTENASLEAESIASLRLALEMRHSGKEEKAWKLFQHAYALNPTHPDILNYYGEFLEEHGKDVLQAEQLYSRALTLSPDHLKALVNRQRTLPMVKELDEYHLTQIDIKRDHLINIPDSDSSLRKIKKEAYFLHIYHTVGLEGNTMTLMETRQIVETRLAVGGKSLVENNEVLGLDAALLYVNSTLVHKLGALTTGDILEIHRRVMGYVTPIEAGHFRVTQVFVGNHIPPHPSDVLILMNEFLQWLNSEEALRLHPVRYAALAHYKLVYIHPFTDGNGRTSRLLMNLILMRAGFPPVIIRKHDRLSYYKYLEMANEGDVRPFIRFVAECTERTLDVYLYATKESVIPALENGRLHPKATIIV